MQINKLKYVNIREVWKYEAHHFTKWLADHIDFLNDKLSFTLNVLQTEKQVGSFNVDIFCEDEQGNTVIIENQLEKTDHNHLGQIMTYAVGTAAKRIIWISPEPRVEHVEVFEWLNETTPIDMEWYLFKLDAIYVGESAISPLFTKVVGPSQEIKNRGNEKKEMAERHHVRLEFWQKLLDCLNKSTKLFQNINPREDNWIDASTGVGGVYFSIIIRKQNSSLQFVLDRVSSEFNKKGFDILLSKKEEIEQSFGFPILWRRMDDKRSSRIQFDLPYCSLESSTWSEGMPKLVERFVHWEKIFKPYLDLVSKV